MSPKLDHTFAWTKSTTNQLQFSVMLTNISNPCLDNLPSFSDNKILYAEIETIFGRHFAIKCLSHNMERKSKKNVASSLTVCHATWTLSSLSKLLMPQAADELRTVNMHYSLIRPIWTVLIQPVSLSSKPV